MSQSNDTSFADYLDRYTFEYILQQMLNKIPDTLDKREGSIIWDALAPAAQEMAKIYIQLKSILINTYPATAVAPYLDLRVQERGMERRAATYAVKKGTFVNQNGEPATIPLGARFSTVGDENPLNFTVTAVYEESGIEQAGEYELTCETAGTAGNNYVGNLLPITNLPELKSATMGELLIPAQDTETDDELYDRYKLKVNETAFGGNIAQYREFMGKISGVSAAQIYPVWQGGGTVKAAIIGADFGLASYNLIELAQKEIDPDPSGTGLGMAPIGHKVTVTTATRRDVNVEVSVNVVAGYTAEQIKSFITPVLEQYFLETRKKWGETDDQNNYFLNMYRANIIADIIGIPQILNVTQVLLDGENADISFTENSTTQELPFLGEVVVNVQ